MATDLYSPIATLLGPCIINSSTTATRAYARLRVHYTTAAHLEFCIKWQSTTATKTNARSCSQNSLAANLSTIVVASTTCTVETIG